LTTEGVVSWTFAPEFDAASRAALESGKPLIYVAPPAAWAVRPLLERLPPQTAEGLGTLVLVPERLQATELQAESAGIPTLAPVRLATGLERTGRLIETGRTRTLVATPQTAVGLLGRSALDASGLERVVVCWPETHASLGSDSDVDALLGEARGAQRIIVTAQESAARDFVGRYAHRAPAVMAGTLPESPLASLRYAVVASTGLERAVEHAIERLAPETVLLWDPSPAGRHRWIGFATQPGMRVSAAIDSPEIDLAVAADLPSADALDALHRLARQVLVLVRPSQLGYLRAMVRDASPLPVSGEVDRARDWREELRRTVRRRIETGRGEAALLALGPLFEEFDPALVAAALVESDVPTRDSTAVPDVPLWAHLHLNVGKRDNVRPGDLVGALLNAVGLSKEQVGRVDVRDTFALVEVRAESVEAARTGLHGMTVRGRTLAVRFDRK
jgi:hypothetical protein